MSREPGYHGNECISERLARYLCYEVTPDVFRMSMCLSRGERGSAGEIGEALLGSMEERLSSDFMLEPAAHYISLEVSELVRDIRRGGDAVHKLSRFYGRIYSLLPLLEKGSLPDRVYPGC